MSLKVLDVMYLFFHLRLNFFVKEQRMSETKWHLRRLKALTNADNEFHTNTEYMSNICTGLSVVQGFLILMSIRCQSFGNILK